MTCSTPRIAFLSILALMTASMTVNAATLENIQVGTTTRTMIAYAPAKITPKRPLLISMHGMSQDAAYQQNQAKWELVADTANFVVVYPNGISNSWDISGTRDIDFVLTIIDTMASRYDIDRNRVYLSGFSMGGMFTYHAMNRIADKIAAFGPVSGYPLSGGNYTSSRPVPIIHVHGDADDVVTYTNLPGYLQGWVTRNNCPATPVVTKPYPSNLPNSSATKTYWGPGDAGVEVVLMTIGGKGHWHSMDPASILTSVEIWNFCKRYALDLSEPVVSFSKPVGASHYVVMGANAQAAVEALTFEVKASDPDGHIDTVAYYNGNTLLYKTTTAPYSFRWENVPAGNHQVRAVAIDNEGKTGSATVNVNVEAPQQTHSFTQAFTTAGTLPAGWMTYDGAETRIGFQSGLSSGCRIFQLTGTPRDFNYGLYVRNTSGEPKAGRATLGSSSGAGYVLLHPGVYTLNVGCANWNMTAGGQVTCQVNALPGDSTLTSLTFLPTSNIGNAMSNPFSGTSPQKLWFQVTQPTIIAITLYTQDTPWADFVLGGLTLTKEVENALTESRARFATTYGKAQTALSTASDPMYAGVLYNALSALVTEYNKWQSDDITAYESAISRLETATNDLLQHKAAIDATETEIIVFADHFSGNAGTLPKGWETNDGTTSRIGPLTGLGQGSRILHFTGSPRDFDDGLYIRNIDGKASEGFAKFGSTATDTVLTLKKGKYRLSYRVCNWNMTGFGAIKGRLINRSTGTVIVEKTVTPTCNIGNNAGNAFSGSSLIEQAFQLDVDTQGSLEFYTADAGWADAIISGISLSRIVYTALPETAASRAQPVKVDHYDLRGMPLKKLPNKGLYLVRTTYADGRMRVEKVLAD
ncbi:MAG: hypothetical protein GXY09_02365 [Bacteroidales bacterium]|nr:hypothetical protein [Bacteroidales bacterium]